MTAIVCRIVEVCAFRFVKDHPEYLLLKRSPDEKIYPGIWQFVSGAIDEGEKAVDAALREFKEETSLNPQRFWVVPYANTFYDHDYDAVNVSPLFAAQVQEKDEPKLSVEHRTYDWLRYDEACRRLVWPGQRQGLKVIEEFIVSGQQASMLTLIPL